MSGKKNFSRRDFLRHMSQVTAGAALAPLAKSAHAQGNSTQNRKFFISLCGIGGASILHSAMALRESEVTAAGGDASRLTCFPDREVVSVGDGPYQLRAVDGAFDVVGPQNILVHYDFEQSPIFHGNFNDIAVMTCTGSSINHQVAQQRSLNGGGIMNGRTMQELVAMQHGHDLPLPNINMSSGGFLMNGRDPTVPSYARREAVFDPMAFSMGTDGMLGVRPSVGPSSNRTQLPMPDRALFEKARALRNQELDPNSAFTKTFGLSSRLRRLRNLRETSLPVVEQQQLLQKLLVLPASPLTPWRQYGIEPAPESAWLWEEFPGVFSFDPLDTQAALAFLLVKYQVSSAITISPTYGPGVNQTQPTLAFDSSHYDTYGSQAFMWNRVLKTADTLARLLKNEEVPDGSGDSFWDRTVIYFATDFGRSRRRQPNARLNVSTMHDINNAFMIWSPMVNGGRVYGGIDPRTGYTYGFDPQTGEANPSTHMQESDVFAAVMQLMGVQTPGLPDFSIMRRT